MARSGEAWQSEARCRGARLGAAGRALVQERFDAKRMSDTLLEAYRAILREKAGAQ